MAVNQYLIDVLPLLQPLSLVDNQAAVAAGSSNLTGTALRLAQATRFTTVPSTGVAVLPSLLTGEANLPVIVINDGANALTVYAYADVIGHPESINGTASTFGGATGGLSIAAGRSAIFIPQDSPKGRQGAGSASGLNWSAQVFT